MAVCKAINSLPFVVNAKAVHKNRYGYTHVDYINSRTKVKIVCKVHGIFEQTPKSHSRGKGCPSCAPNKAYTQQTFLKRLNDQFGAYFDYSQVVFNGTRENVTLICPEHGKFDIKAKSLLESKHACAKCSGVTSFTKKDFVDKANEVHDKLYNYQKVKFKNTKTNVLIVCKNHGSFSQSPHHHLAGQGCPSCKKSIGESIILGFLQKHKIKFTSEFPLLKNKSTNRWLRSDFFIHDLNLIIEFDGIQHFKSVPIFGGPEKLKLTKKHDKMKDRYCDLNNIDFIRFNYKDKKEYILEKLTNLLC
jgi:hypothetical protein